MLSGGGSLEKRLVHPAAAVALSRNTQPERRDASFVNTGGRNIFETRLLAMSVSWREIAWKVQESSREGVSAPAISVDSFQSSQNN